MEAVQAATFRIAVIEPTAAGQIGVNLVGPIPSPSALVGKIGKNTQYLTGLGGSVTSWKGPDPSFITQTTITATNTAGEVVTTTKGASVSVTQDNEGNFNILLGPDLRAKLTRIAETVPVCDARKRSSSCGYRAFAENVANSGPLTEVAEIENAMPAGRLLIPANDVAALVAMFRAGASNTVTLPVAAGGGTLAFLYLIYAQWNDGKSIPAAMDIPHSIAGTATTTAAPTSTATSCPVGDDRPSCSDDECKGNENKKCTQGEQKDCECVSLGVIKTRDIAVEWLDLYSVVDQISLTTVSEPVALCDNKKFGLSEGLWKAIVTEFCASQPLTENINTTMTAKNVDFRGYDDWSFDLNWQHTQGDCVFGCEEMFTRFFKSKSCSDEPDVFSESGTNSQDCGTASFKIKHPAKVCVERIIIDCIYHYKDRPELSMSECPPVPVLDISCRKDPSTEAPPPAKPTTPEQYCIPSTSDQNCTFAVETLFNAAEPILKQNNAFIYDSACKEIGQSKDIKAGISITSELPYTIDIQFFDVDARKGFDWTTASWKNLIILRFAYAGQVVGKWTDYWYRPWSTERSSCTESDLSDNLDIKKVSRCSFECTKKS